MDRRASAHLPPAGHDAWDTVNLFIKDTPKRATSLIRTLSAVQTT